MCICICIFGLTQLLPVIYLQLNLDETSSAVLDRFVEIAVML